MNRKIGLTILWVALLSGEIATAHHSLSAEFDVHKMAMLSGTITRMEWGNPHTWVFVDVTDAAVRRRTSWALQLPSPNLFDRLGWHREPFQLGTTINISGYRAKDGSRKLCVLEATSPDGKSLYVDRAAR